MLGKIVELFAGPAPLVLSCQSFLVVEVPGWRKLRPLAQGEMLTDGSPQLRASFRRSGHILAKRDQERHRFHDWMKWAGE